MLYAKAAKRQDMSFRTIADMYTTQTQINAI